MKILSKVLTIDPKVTMFAIISDLFQWSVKRKGQSSNSQNDQLMKPYEFKYMLLRTFFNSESKFLK